MPSITEGLGNLLARNHIAVELVQARQAGVSFAIENSTLLPELRRKVDQSVQLRVEEERAVIGLVGATFVEVQGFIHREWLVEIEADCVETQAGQDVIYGTDDSQEQARR